MTLLKNMNHSQRIGLILAIFILFVDMLLYSLIIPIVPYFTDKLHLSPTTLGILFSSYAVALLATTLFFGPLSDRIGRKWPIVIGLAGLALSTMLFAFAQTTVTLIAARFVQGIASAAAWTTSLALLADLFPGKTRGPAMGIALTGMSTGTLLGAPISGWLFEWGGYRLPFLFSAGLIVCIAAMVWVFLKEPERLEGKRTAGILPLLRNRSVLLIACIVLLVETTMTLLEPILPVYVTETFGVSPAAIGLLFGVMTLAYGIAAPLSGSLANRKNPFFVMLFGLIGLAVAMPLLVAFPSLLMEVAAMALVGAAIGFTLSPTLSSLGELVDRGSGDYGTAYALFNMFHAVGMIAGPMAGGVLTDALPISAAIMTASAAVLIAAIILLFAVKYSVETNPGYTARK